MFEDFSGPQEELVGELATLSKVLGSPRCAAARQLRLCPEDFPDPWDGDLISVRVVLRRLLKFAGEDDVSAPVSLIDSREFPPRGDTLVGEIHYAGVLDDCLCFDVANPGDPRALIGPACLEVARSLLDRANQPRAAGYRQPPTSGQPNHVGKALPDDLQALLACYLLGWGVLVTNACYDPRTQGLAQDGGWASMSWQTANLSFDLSVATWVLAAIDCAGGREAAATAQHLNPSQSKLYLRHRRELDGCHEVLRKQLGWAAITTVPVPIAVTPIVRDAYDRQLAAKEAARTRFLPNLGRPTFRVIETAAVQMTLLGFTLGVVFIIPGLTAYGAVSLLAIVVGSGIGLVIGLRRRVFVCSEPECRRRLTPSDTICPGCGGSIRGDLKRADERLEAREES